MPQKISNEILYDLLKEHKTDTSTLLNNIANDVSATKAQAFKTNGRVTTLETRMLDYDEIKMKVEETVNYRWKLIGIGIGFTAVSALIITLGVIVINNKIEDMIDNRMVTVVQSVLEPFGFEFPEAK